MSGSREKPDDALDDGLIIDDYGNSHCTNAHGTTFNASDAEQILFFDIDQYNRKNGMSYLYI